MRTWSAPRQPREQAELIGASLDEVIGPDDGIRVLDALLREVDWSEWEAKYPAEGPGRPPHHPRLMCGAILYGLIKRIHSTRDLEEATRVRIDFHWLLERRTIDHTTFATFRNRFGGQIHDLFVQINRQAARLRKLTLEELVIDGTRVRAHCDRHGARSAASLQKRLARLEAQIEEGLEKLAEENEEPSEASLEALEQQQAKLEAQREKLQRALEVARERDRIKKAKKGKEAPAVRVPVSDPDAHVLPNKEGGHAPNYTPIIAVETQEGLIVAEEIDASNTERGTAHELVEQSSDSLGASPARVLFDDGFATGRDLEALSANGTEVYAKLGAGTAANPADRENPREPVAEELRDGLAVRAGQFDRSAFVYESDEDRYYCPMGQALKPVSQTKRKMKDGTPVSVTRYGGADCANCVLAARCLGKKGGSRAIMRDQYEEHRERIRERIKTEEGQACYARRAPSVEGVFGVIKSTIGLRQFSRRGLCKVRADWTWTCTAYNLLKLMKSLGAKGSPGDALAAIQALHRASGGLLRRFRSSWIAVIEILDLYRPLQPWPKNRRQCAASSA